MKKLNHTGNYLGLALFFVAFLAMLYNAYQFRHHFAFTVGRVTRITPPRYRTTGNYSVLYEYKVKDKVYSQHNSYNYCRGQTMAQIRTLLIGKHFPVAYGTKDNSAATMLLTQENADKFKYTLPDSLRIYDTILTCK